MKKEAGRDRRIFYILSVIFILSLMHQAYNSLDFTKGILDELGLDSIDPFLFDYLVSVLSIVVLPFIATFGVRSEVKNAELIKMAESMINTNPSQENDEY